MPLTQLAGVVYTQSSVYQYLNPADYNGMNNGTADGSQNNEETGINSYDPGSYIQADCGSVQTIDHVVIGYDYLTNLGATAFESWGAVALNGATLQGSTDGTTWTPIATIPDYDTTGSQNGLLAIPVNADYQYLQVTTDGEWLAMTEFEVWVAGAAYTAPEGSFALDTPCTVQDLRIWLQSWDELYAGVEADAAVVSSATGLTIGYPYNLQADGQLVFGADPLSRTLTTPCTVQRLRIFLQRWDALRPGVEVEASLSATDNDLTVTFPPGTVIEG